MEAASHYRIIQIAGEKSPFHSLTGLWRKRLFCQLCSDASTLLDNVSHADKDRGWGDG
jgi:hypothetical protein